MRFDYNKRSRLLLESFDEHPVGCCYFIELNDAGQPTFIELKGEVSSILGMDAEVIVEQLGWTAQIEATHHSSYHAHRNSLTQGKVGLSAYRINLADGTSRWIVDTARPLWGEGEDHVGAIEGRLVDLEKTPGLVDYVKDLIDLD